MNQEGRFTGGERGDGEKRMRGRGGRRQGGREKGVGEVSDSRLSVLKAKAIKAHSNIKIYRNCHDTVLRVQH